MKKKQRKKESNKESFCSGPTHVEGSVSFPKSNIRNLTKEYREYIGSASICLLLDIDPIQTRSDKEKALGRSRLETTLR